MLLHSWQNLMPTKPGPSPPALSVVILKTLLCLADTAPRQVWNIYWVKAVLEVSKSKLGYLVHPWLIQWTEAVIEDRGCYIGQRLL